MVPHAAFATSTAAATDAEGETNDRSFASAEIETDTMQSFGTGVKWKAPCGKRAAPSVYFVKIPGEDLCPFVRVQRKVSE